MAAKPVETEETPGPAMSQWFNDEYWLWQWNDWQRLDVTSWYDEIGSYLPSTYRAGGVSPEFPLSSVPGDSAAVLLAVNTDVDAPRTAWVTIDDGLHAAGSRLTCLYSTDASQIGSTVEVEPRNGKAVQLTVPAAGFVAFA